MNFLTIEDKSYQNINILTLILFFIKNCILKIKSDQECKTLSIYLKF